MAGTIFEKLVPAVYRLNPDRYAGSRGDQFKLPRETHIYGDPIQGYFPRFQVLQEFPYD